MGEVTRATRVAYVKFMKKKFAAEESIDTENLNKAEGETTTAPSNVPSAFARATLKKLEVCLVYKYKFKTKK